VATVALLYAAGVGSVSVQERLYLRLDEDAGPGPDVTVPHETLRALPVRRELGAAIESVLSYRESIPAGEQVLERVLPDGAVRLVFNLGALPSVNGVADVRGAVVGAAATPVLVQLSGRVHGLSVTLRPGAARALCGVPATELAESAAPLDVLWGRAGAELLERLEAAPDERVRGAVLHDVLLGRLRAADTRVSRAARQAAALIAARAGRGRQREVAAALGIGERRLEQLFREHVGLTPRRYARLARLWGCLRALRSEPAPRWAELAVRAGYYDQAHLSNEFRSLCGISPRELLRRRTSESSKTPP